MEYGKLGSLSVSRVGYGCWAMGGHGWGKVNDTDSINSVRRALDLGINFFDTADVYGLGHSETILGKALGPQKNDAVIATKFGVTWDKNKNIGRDCSPQYIVQSLEGSLKRLEVECIDLYQIHWPDFNTKIEDTIDTLQRCQAQGKLRYIGCSNFDLKDLSVCTRLTRITSLQLPYSILEMNSSSELIAYSHAHKIGVLTYGSLAKGLCSGKFTEETRFGPEDTRSRDPNFQGRRFYQNLKMVKLLGQLGEKYGKTSGQVALRWILDTPGVTVSIVGVKTPAQIEEHVGALGWSLQAEDYSYLSNQANILLDGCSTKSEKDVKCIKKVKDTVLVN